jgi:deoxyadenosine/deoxycytidine kinase
LNNRTSAATASAKCSLDFLKQSNVNLKIIPEPVHLWRNLEGHNLLDLMYEDPVKWAFPFHSYVQLTMLENHMELNKYASSNSMGDENGCFGMDDLHINIMERSLYSAKYCFAENLYKS